MDITWRQRALDDLELARRYIAAEDPRAASRIMQRVLSTVAHLATTPHMGRSGRVAETRELVVSGTPYIVAYAVIGGEVVVLDVLHGAQDWPEGFK